VVDDIFLYFTDFLPEQSIWQGRAPILLGDDLYPADSVPFFIFLTGIQESPGQILVASIRWLRYNSVPAFIDGSLLRESCLL
jgi:hypothetical protein